MLRQVARVTLFSIYRAAALIDWFGRLRSPRDGGPIVLIGTFHNPNWILAHVQPIAMAGVDEVILIADEPIEPIANVRCLCPPAWMQRTLSRAGAKLVWSLVAGCKYKPSLFMGYHVFPSGVIALVSAAICGGRSAFQVTSGPLELDGGGWAAENPLLVALQYESPAVENAVLAMCRCFDFLVVRGKRAVAFLRDRGCTQAIEVVTGSVVCPAPDELPGFEDRPIDVLFIGRLAATKRVDRLIRILSKVLSEHPGSRATFVGDGPDRETLEVLACELGCRDSIEFVGQQSDVESYQLTAKIFALTSAWEGVSIAMIEAMGCGCVPVVSNVGDLADFVDDETGYLLAEEDLDAFVMSISNVLSDQRLWRELSGNSRRRIDENSSKAVITERWKNLLLEYR